MNLEKRLARWSDAGLISIEDAGKIRAWEQEHASPSWILFGLAGLGVTVVLTGVISIIAANWGAISPFTKLAVYFLILFLLGGAFLRRDKVPGVVRETLLVAFSLFVLAGIGLIGQIYHLTRSPHGALFLWLALIFPATLIASSRFLNHLWCGGFVLTMWIWLLGSPLANPTTESNLIITLPWLFLTVGYLLWNRREHFAAATRLWGFGLLLLCFAPLANIAWSEGAAAWRSLRSDTVSHWLPLAGFLLTLGAVGLRHTVIGRGLSCAITTTIIFTALLIFGPLYFELTASMSNQILGCALFIGAWSGAAAIAAAMNRRRLFDLAAAVIAIRFIIVYFEVFGSLAATGFGLIVSGSVILGMAYVWHRFRGDVARALKEGM